MLLKCKKYFWFYKGWMGILMLILLSAWKFAEDLDPAKAVEQCLVEVFDASADPLAIKKWELTITNNGFFRIKKYYSNGKQEYFSFKLKRLQVVDYLGTEEGGILLLRTNDNAIIVQTYNDPKGNIDSTSSTLKVPLKNITAERLNLLQDNFSQLRK